MFGKLYKKVSVCVTFKVTNEPHEALVYSDLITAKAVFTFDFFLTRNSFLV